MTDDLGTFYEALLFIAERPLETDELAKLGEVPRLQAEAALSALAERLDEGGRGLRVQHHDGAWQLVTAPEVGALLTQAGVPAESTAAGLIALAMVVIFALVTGRILKLATDSNLFTGVTLSLTYFLVINLLLHLASGGGG